MYDYLGSSDKKVEKLFAKMKELELSFIIGEYGTEHYGRKVAWDELIRLSAKNEVGRLIWSFFGNSSSLKPLDFVKFYDFETLTESGRKLFEHPFGVRYDSTEACYFENNCDSEQN